MCHQVNGVGMKIGPGLSRLARRTRERVVEHFANPRNISPGSTMPPYKSNAKDQEAITAYLMGYEAVLSDAVGWQGILTEARQRVRSVECFTSALSAKSAAVHCRKLARRSVVYRG